MEQLEILKLKQMLEEAKIPFEFTDDFFHGDHKPSYQIIIRDKDKENQERSLCNAIYHYGSYGYDQNLLEIMGALTEEEEEDNSVLGYLTADEVFKRFKYCYEHNTKYYIEEGDGINHAKL